MSGFESTATSRSSASRSTLRSSSAIWFLSSCRHPGKSFEKGAPAAVVESCKAASDVYAPISGQVVETNESIVADPTLVNSDPLGNGWFFKLKIANPSEIDSLMDEKTYKAQIGSKA